MNDDTKISLLKDEYLLLQRFYEDFDARAMTIKGWSATIAVAAIGAGFYQSRLLWLFSAAASLVFWVLESLWKSFQYLYAPRITIIERAFLTSEFDQVAPFQIYQSWIDVFRSRGFRIAHQLKMPIIAFPHLLTAVVALLLFILEVSHVFTIGRHP